jgi:hypothetical protein
MICILNYLIVMNEAYENLNFNERENESTYII